MASKPSTDGDAPVIAINWEKLETILKVIFYAAMLFCTLYAVFVYGQVPMP